MSSTAALVAVVAIIPAAMNPSLVVRDKTLSALVCGSGVTVSIPVGSPDLPGSMPSMCCAKGCQTKSRKLAKSAQFDPEQ